MNAFRSFAAVCLCAPMAIGLAQEPRRLVQPDSIPIDLATALIGTGGVMGEPQILIGSLPGWMMELVQVPKGASVLGAAFSGSSVVGVLRSPEAPETLIGEFSRDLPKLGWTAPPPWPGRNSGGGFRWASQSLPRPASGPPTALTLCHDKQMLMISAGRRRGVASLATLRLNATPGATTICNPPALPEGYTPPLPLPLLFNPDDATDGYRPGASCMKAMTSDQNGSSGTSAMLITTRSAESIMEFYTKQLKDSGWGAPVASRTTMTREWVRMDSAGAPVIYQLNVAPVVQDSTCHRIELYVRKPKKTP